jgi:hypothetical protein
MGDATKYILMKKCCQCFHINDGSLRSCAQCGYLLLTEATEQEKQAANDKLEKMRAKAGENPDAVSEFASDDEESEEDDLD